MDRVALVTGAGGFIGGAMLRYLWETGAYSELVAVDIKPPERWWQRPAALPAVDYCDKEYFVRRGGQSPCRLAFYPCTDLRTVATATTAVEGADDIFHFAAWMGGMGFIETHRLECLLFSSQINDSVVAALLKTRGSDRTRATRVFWSGSACAYPVNQQSSTEVTSLPEDLAWQGQPEEGYGEEKLTSESLFRYLREDRGITTHVARFHNVYGPRGSWNDGREKAPAAICRKVAEAKLAGNHTITIWGDGTRTRSFMYIDDCIEGIRRIMESEVYGPINLGSEEQVSIRELVEIVADIAGIKVEIECDMTRPQGVAGRNSDNTMIREKLGWEPKIPLREGLEKTYTWIEQKVKDGFKRWPTV